MLRRWFPYSTLLFGLALTSGCHEAPAGPDPAVVAQYRSRFQLTEEPAGAVNVLELRETLLAASPGATPIGPPSVVVGKIGGIPNPWGAAEPNYPWVKGKARFFLADAAASLELGEQAHAHEEGEECPFCANAARSDAIAVVRFLDTDGKPIHVDTRGLFELKEGQTVVVRGVPNVTGTGKDALLIFDAVGVYVRR